MASFLRKHAEGSSSESIAREIARRRTAHLDKTVPGSQSTCCDVDVVVGDRHENRMTNVAEIRTIVIKKEIESERLKDDAKKRQVIRLPSVGCSFQNYIRSTAPGSENQVTRALVNLLVEYQKSQGRCWKGEPDGGYTTEQRSEHDVRLNRPRGNTGANKPTASVAPFHARDNSLALTWFHSAIRYHACQMDQPAVPGAVLNALSEHASYLSLRHHRLSDGPLQIQGPVLASAALETRSPTSSKGRTQKEGEDRGQQWAAQVARVISGLTNLKACHP